MPPKSFLLDLIEALIVLASVIGQKLVQVKFFPLSLVILLNRVTVNAISRKIGKAGGGPARVRVTQRLLWCLESGRTGQSACARPDAAVLLLIRQQK